MRFFLTLFFLSVVFSSFAQQDGYWDKERTTNKQIELSAYKKLIVKSEDFPVGTTQIVYRITVLNENQVITSSLVDVLKAIPDPTGISKGSAGAVFLLSKISGNDKCIYNIFALEKYANEYAKSGKNDKACFFQNKPISSEAKLLSVGKSSCLNVNTENIYFGLESKNWVMNQKIVLEIVPWVDYKLSRGWNIQNKQQVLNQCKNSETGKKVQNADTFCICQLEKLQDKYRFVEFQNLLQAEKINFLQKSDADCIAQTGENLFTDSKIRASIDTLIKEKKYDLALEKLLIISNKTTATASDFNNLSTCYLLTKQFQKSLINSNKAVNLDSNELLFQLNLAHVLMFLNDIKASKNIHVKFKNQNINNNQSWIEKTKIDFELFEKTGLPNENFNKILRILD